ncbi:hypothetical protein Slala03_37450 [Streptomyces lavendulae subsp. lavendulae]|nr:hypothetical protein Slala03_37450 [Streptomyces lavendulae subsp. lavendulae]GLX38732.1 hypothetical protein Sros01_48050 [Streptomyces roseochromogenus]
MVRLGPGRPGKDGGSQGAGAPPRARTHTRRARGISRVIIRRTLPLRLDGRNDCVDLLTYRTRVTVLLTLMSEGPLR